MIFNEKCSSLPFHLVMPVFFPFFVYYVLTICIDNFYKFNPYKN